MAELDAGPQGDASVRFGTSQQTFPLAGTLFEKIARVVTERFNQSETHVRARFERFYRYEKILSMISKRKAFDWKANAYLPYALSVAEQSAAIKFLALLGSRPFVTVTARQAGLETVADHREALLDWHFLGDVNVLNLGADMLRVSERYGKSIALVAPDWDQKILRYRSAVNLPTTYGPIARMQWKTTQERAYKIRTEMMDLTDFFPQPGYKRINGRGGMRWCHRRYYLTIDELRQLEQTNLWGPELGGQSVDEIRDTQDQDISEYKARRLFMDKYDDTDRFRDLFDRTVEIVEYQGVVPDELIDPQLAEIEVQAGLDPKKRVLAVANKKVVGINQALPWDHGMKSYIEMDSIPNAYDFYGTGKVEPIEHLIYVGNEIMNMRIDNVKAAINGIIGVDGSRMPAGWKRRLTSQPWGVVECMGPPTQVVQRFQLGDVTSSSYQEQQQIFTLIQEASAVNETLIGAPGGPVRTLGEQQLKSQSATTRLSFELATQANQFFGATRDAPGLVYFILALDRQYLPLPQYMSVVNPMDPDDFAEIQLQPGDLSPQDDEKFIYTAQGALEGMNRQSRRLEFSQLNSIIAPMFPMILGAGFNVVEYAKDALRVFGSDPDRYFPRIAGVVQPDAVGMGTGPGMAPPAGPGGPPGPGPPGPTPPGQRGSVQPFLRQAGVGTQPGQNRYVGKQ